MAGENDDLSPSQRILDQALRESGIGSLSSEKPASGNEGQSNDSQNNSSTTQSGSGGNNGNGTGGAGNQNGNSGQNNGQNDDDFNNRYEAKLKETFGFDSPALAQALEKAKQSGELLAASPYKTDLGKAMDDLLSKNISPEVAIQYLQTDISKLTDKQVLALDMKLRANGEISDDDIDGFIDRKYKIGSAKVDDAGEADGNLQLKIDVQSLRQDAQKTKEKMLERGESRELVAAKHSNAERVKGWEAKKSEVINAVKTIELPLSVDKEGKVLQSFKFELGNSSTEALTKELDRLIQFLPKMQANEEGVKAAIQMVRDRAIISNLPQIMKSMATFARGQNDAWWAGYLDNSTLGNQNGGQGNHGSASGKSTDEQLAEQFLNMYGGKR